MSFTILRGRFTYQNAGTNQAAGTIHERVLIETLLYVCSLVGIFFVPVLTLSFHKPWVSNFLATSQHNVTCKCFWASIHKKRAKRRSFHMSESCHKILKSSLLFSELFSRLLFLCRWPHSCSLESNYQLCCCVPKYVPKMYFLVALTYYYNTVCTVIWKTFLSWRVSLFYPEVFYF